KTDSLGEGTVTLGGSEYLKQIHSTVAGQPPKTNVALELAVQAVCRHGIRQGWIVSAHDCAEGGLAIALCESSISGQKGANVTLTQGALRTDTLLFGEGGARILVSVAAEHKLTWEQYAQANLADSYSFVGTVADLEASMTIGVADQKNLINLPVSDLKAEWSNAIEKALSI
ncbi:MAG: AIR synthase-related protein, partial [Cyanobacteria bacterium J06555_13]